MDTTDYNNIARTIRDLEKQLDMPVIVLAGRWMGTHAYDFDDAALRKFYNVLSGIIRDHESPSDIALYIVGQGAWPSFGDGLRRVLECYEINYHVILTTRLTGVLALVALNATALICHPMGALGAIDLGLVADHETKVDVPKEALVLANRIFMRHNTRPDPALIKSVSVSALGQSGGLSVRELKQLGLNVEAVPQTLPEIWLLYCQVECLLNLHQPDKARFREVELADEVEFEPATQLTTAAIISINHYYEYCIDTGAPDPDTTLMVGYWREMNE